MSAETIREARPLVIVSARHAPCGSAGGGVGQRSGRGAGASRCLLTDGQARAEAVKAAGPSGRAVNQALLLCAREQASRCRAAMKPNRYQLDECVSGLSATQLIVHSRVRLVIQLADHSGRRKRPPRDEFRGACLEEATQLGGAPSRRACKQSRTN
jgi:hypothetical protein